MYLMKNLFANLLQTLKLQTKPYITTKLKLKLNGSKYTSTLL